MIVTEKLLKGHHPKLIKQVNKLKLNVEKTSAEKGMGSKSIKDAKIHVKMQK